MRGVAYLEEALRRFEASHESLLLQVDERERWGKKKELEKSLRPLRRKLKVARAKL